MKVLMIIPAYNEEKSIVNTVNMIKKTKLKGHTLDYVIINDGSKDNTKQICIDNGFNFIDLPINLGIGGAVQTGYKYAEKNKYDICKTIDGVEQFNMNGKFNSYLDGTFCFNVLFLANPILVNSSLPSPVLNITEKPLL